MAPPPGGATRQSVRLGRVGKKLQTLLVTMPELAQFKEQVSIEITEEGLRIDLLERDGASFFEVGSPRLRPTAVAILERVMHFDPCPQVEKYHGKTKTEGHAQCISALGI